MFLVGARLSILSIVGLALFCGGGLSNLLDRAVWGGTVVDFLEVEWGPVRTCIFNLADVAVVLGMALGILSLVAALLRPLFGAPLEGKSRRKRTRPPLKP